MRRKHIIIFLLVLIGIFFLYIIIGNLWWYNPEKAREKIEREKDSVRKTGRLPKK